MPIEPALAAIESVVFSAISNRSSKQKGLQMKALFVAVQKQQRFIC